MAEYIDRNELPIPEDVLTSDAFEAWLVRRDENRDEALGLVERSKIDKAIEEIEDLNNAKYGFEAYYQCKAEVLEIIKRNIGE